MQQVLFFAAGCRHRSDVRWGGEPLIHLRNPRPAVGGVRPATTRFHDVGAAGQAGHLNPGPGRCAEVPELGGMGIELVTPALIFDGGILDPTRPAVLLYAPTAPGRLRLVGLEHLVPVTDCSGSEAPDSFGTPFDSPMPEHEANTTDDHYDQRAWVRSHNPEGALSSWNKSLMLVETVHGVRGCDCGWRCEKSEMGTGKPTRVWLASCRGAVLGLDLSVKMLEQARLRRLRAMLNRSSVREESLMFAQVIRAKVLDAQAVENQFRRWVTEVAPGTSGWRDLTGGVTRDGNLIAVARFESAEHARASSGRQEQDAWWKETRTLLDDEPTFYESEDVTELWEGPLRDAGFVQMMLATVADRTTVERIEEYLDDAFRRWRPDALGGYRVWLPDGRMLAVDYFSSEAEARAGERSEPPQDIAEAFPKWMAQMSDQEWIDLPAPWIAVS